MRRAIQHARMGEGRTSPNPLVGAVLTDRGRLVAEAHHARFGGTHAERRLLASLGARSASSRAELFLTLEPCSYHGKTPPCVEALLETGIRRFVVATRDPNPRVRGRGIAALRRDGREVRVGLLAREAREINLPFFLGQQEGRARVSLKIASTIDGRVADAKGRSCWITGREARREVARIRTRVDAILVGSETVRQDDPRLRPSAVPGRSPSRIVLDGRRAVEPGCRLARLWREEVGSLPSRASRQIGNWIALEGGRSTRWIRRPRLILATMGLSDRRSARFERAGWEIWHLPARKERVDLDALVRRAAREGLIDLLVEPGPRLAGAFLDSGPVDRILLFLAPSVLGGGHGWSSALTPRRLEEALRLAQARPVRVFGRDLLVELTGAAGAAIVPSRRGERPSRPAAM